MLGDGRRGFILRQTMEVIGFEGNKGSARFEAFCAKIGAIALSNNGESNFPFTECDNPHGARAAVFIPSHILHERAAPCMRISDLTRGNMRILFDRAHTEDKAMARMSIYVPDELKCRMDAVDSVNWSSVAQSAFERELRLHVKPLEEEMEAIIERLKASKAAQTDDVIAAGAEAGKKWAMETASYLDLSWAGSQLHQKFAFRGTTKDHTGEHESLKSFPKLRDGREISEFLPANTCIDEYFEHGFCKGVLSVWQKVKDHI